MKSSTKEQRSAQLTFHTEKIPQRQKKIAVIVRACSLVPRITVTLTQIGPNSSLQSYLML